MFNDPTKDFFYKGITLVRTCFACPEQYDAFDWRKEKVGYLRLRHGEFTVEVPTVGGRTVYTALPVGDGMFEDIEREQHLVAAVEAICTS